LGLNCSNTNTNAQPTDGFYLEKAPADTNWFGVIRTASSDGTRLDTGVAFAAGSTQWVSARLRKTGSNTMGVTINGGSEGTVTGTFATTGCHVWLMVRYESGGTGGAKILDVDAVDLAITGLSR
jgi:hypothetical protein